MKSLLHILIAVLYTFSVYVSVPHDLLGPDAFEADHYAHWYNFTEERIGATTDCNAPGTTIGSLDKPLQDRAMSLWNPTWSNRVYRIRDFPVDALMECDYLYLRPGEERDDAEIAYCAENPELFRFRYADGWGVFYEVVR